MNRAPLDITADPGEIGAQMHGLIAELYPICRSITGNGFRATLTSLSRHIPLQMHEVPSGTLAFDWTVPDEWNIRDAYVKNARGEKVVDFGKSNLHVMNYSIPVNKTVSLGELKEHLFTLPGHPDWIPYKTAYYKRDWGFCLSHNQMLALGEGEYQVVIDSTLEPGSLSYGELYLPGEEEGEILLSCHACHPSLANDNLSGVSLATLLARELGATSHRYSYRFIFIPGTIGAITWLSLNEDLLPRIRHGLVLSGLGDGGALSYKKSRDGAAEIDRAACHVLQHSGQPHTVEDFIPYGYDERQYCSPGIDLAVGRLSRTPFGSYPQYHTSADNLDFVRPEALGDSFSKVLAILQLLEQNETYQSLNPKCEPQLGKRGLYDSIGAGELAMLWVLNQSDGRHALLDIAERSGIGFASIAKAADRLASHGLLQKLPGAPAAGLHGSPGRGLATV